jgi:hypothetical protein
VDPDTKPGRALDCILGRKEPNIDYHPGFQQIVESVLDEIAMKPVSNFLNSTLLAPSNLRWYAFRRCLKEKGS